LKKAIKLLLVIIGTLIVLECALRLYHHFNPVFVFKSKSYNRFRPKPFSHDYNFRLNSRGFKDIEFSEEKAPDTYRILGIGDSFVYGVVPYEHNFLTLLEEKLNREGKPCEILNMGIICTGVDSYASLLINEGVSLNPDVVMCFFFTGNDFTDKREGVEGLYTVAFFKYLFKIMPKVRSVVATGPGEYRDDFPTHDFDTYYNNIERPRSWIFLAGNKYFSKYLYYAVSYLRVMKGICEENNIAFLVVIVPDEMQVDEALQRRVIADAEHAKEDDYDFMFPNKTLCSALERFNIDYLDLTSQFILAAKKEKLYKPNDTHWNIAGNKLAADLIFDRLSQEVVYSLD